MPMVGSGHQDSVHVLVVKNPPHVGDRLHGVLFERRSRTRQSSGVGIAYVADLDVLDFSEKARHVNPAATAADKAQHQSIVCAGGGCRGDSRSLCGNGKCHFDQGILLCKTILSWREMLPSGVPSVRFTQSNMNIGSGGMMSSAPHPVSST